MSSTHYYQHYYNNCCWPTTGRSCHYLLILISLYIITALTALSDANVALAAAETPPQHITSATTATSSSSSSVTSQQQDSFRAIQVLHTKLDVDADGEVDDLESKIFLESDQISTADSNARRLKYLHQDGNDKSISVDELWESWQNSLVHNWTTDETVYWLIYSVELPEYTKVFEEKSINGTHLPRMATDTHFISKLGITDPSAKSKISIKAMDVVLFGPPKFTPPNKLRDIIVAGLIVIMLSSCGVFYSRSLASQQELREIKDSKLESLKRAESQMLELQQELEAVATEKKNLAQQLEMQRQNSASIESKLSGADSDSNSGDSNVKICASRPLRTLLQTTYDLETQYFNERKLNLESKASQIKARNQKMRHKKATLLGYYRMAQEDSLEEDINAIVEVKESIKQITNDIKERAERWRNIEKLCSCSLDLRP